MSTSSATSIKVSAQSSTTVSNDADSAEAASRADRVASSSSSSSHAAAASLVLRELTKLEPPPDVQYLAVLTLQRHLEQTPDDAIREVARGLRLTPGQTDQFVKDFKAMVQNAATGKLPDLPPEVSAHWASLTAHFEALSGTTRDTGKMAQLGNQLLSGTVSTSLGFALGTFLSKVMLYHGVKDAVQVINVAGLFILLFGEIAAGRVRAQGAGYAPVDTGNMLKYNGYQRKLEAISRLENVLRGAAPGLETDVERERLASLRGKINLSIQKMCVMAFKQEFGHALGMKKRSENADVPEGIVGSRLRSGLKAQPARNSSNDAPRIEIIGMVSHYPLFTVEPGASLKKFVVTWPDGKHTDLCAEAVPAKYQEAMQEMAIGPLMSAVWKRAFVTMDVPFTIFNTGYMSTGAMTPYLTATLKGAALGWADSVQAVGGTIGLTLLLFIAQNAMMSRYSGISVSAGINIRAKVAKADLFDAKRDYFRALSATYQSMYAAVRDGIAALEAELARLETHFVDVPDMRKRREDLRAELAAHQQVLGEIKQKFKMVTKEKRAVNEALATTHGKLESTSRSWGLFLYHTVRKNPMQFAARCAAYTAPFLSFTEIFAPNARKLWPHDVNVTMVDAQGVVHMASQVAPLSHWTTSILVNMNYGWYIGIPLQLRNVFTARYLEQGGAWVASGVQGCYRTVKERIRGIEDEALLQGAGDEFVSDDDDDLDHDVTTDVKAARKAARESSDSDGEYASAQDTDDEYGSDEEDDHAGVNRGPVATSVPLAELDGSSDDEGRNSSLV